MGETHSRNERYGKLDCIYGFCPNVYKFPNGIVAFKIPHYVAMYENFEYKSKDARKHKFIIKIM